MKTMKYFVWAALSLALGACTDENEFLDASKQITVEAGFGASSRVATSGLSSVFEDKDAIGVYAWTGGTALPGASAGYVVHNVTNTYNGTKWTATPQMFWKDAETPHYFLAVYPQTDILATTTYTLDATDQEKSDLLVATNFGKDNGGIVAQSNPVPLAFAHVMAKLRVNIKFNDEFTTAPTVEHVTVGAHATATIDWQTATATATGNATGIELPALATAAQGYACSYESVMVPQSGFKSVVMVIGGETYTFTSNQAMQLKKGTITTLNLTVGLSSIQAEEISILDWSNGTSIAGYLNNIDEQIEAINASLKDLVALDSILQVSISGSEPVALKSLIENLKAYTDSVGTANKDWASTTFVTLEKYTALQTEIAIVKESITGEYTEAINTAIAALEASMKNWVNADFASGYYDIATIDGKLAVLSDALAEGNTELQNQITAQQIALNQAKADLKTAYEKAIKDAIDTNNGVINTAIADAVSAAKHELQSKIDTINNEILGIKTRLDKLEARIQSIRFVPEFSDGKVMIMAEMTSIELTFIVSPKEAAAIAADKVTAFIYHTQSRAVDAVPLTVTGVSGDATTGMLTVTVNLFDNPTENLSGLPADYWATNKTANIYIQINDGNNDITSEMIPAYYYMPPYFTLTNTTNESKTFNLIQNGSVDANLQYSADYGTWTDLEFGVGVPFADNLRLRGKNEHGTAINNQNYLNISVSSTIGMTCSGDIRTLVNWENYENAETKDARFCNLFKGCNSLTDISELKLLPGNATMAEFCYSGMFYQCTGLTAIPESLLPATTLARSCYSEMFYQCKGLTAIPARLLPATALASECYRSMFERCSNLETIPLNLLPATTLANSCYTAMFGYCSGLTSIPAGLLPATTLVSQCYAKMFYQCTGLTAIPESLLPATTLAESCYSRMFQGCSGFSTIPERLLPATTLAKSCYAGMFGYCSDQRTDRAPEYGLSNIPAGLLPATTLAESCYDHMFELCRYLKNIPEDLLPATTLAGYCYYGMFSCSYLETIPAGLLPATTLAESCYESMFSECKQLRSVPEGLLPATTMVPGCYRSMFTKCVNLETVPANFLPATTLALNCYAFMFLNCSKLTTAPTLAAPELVSGCYYDMFQSCSKLNSVTMLATRIYIAFQNPITYYFKQWLQGVNSTGTLYISSEITNTSPDNYTPKTELKKVIPASGWNMVETHLGSLPGISNGGGF